jgi:hypothetical protein
MDIVAYDTSVYGNPDLERSGRPSARIYSLAKGMGLTDLEFERPKVVR